MATWPFESFSLINLWKCIQVVYVQVDHQHRLAAERAGLWSHIVANCWLGDIQYTYCIKFLKISSRLVCSTIDLNLYPMMKKGTKEWQCVYVQCITNMLSFTWHKKIGRRQTEFPKIKSNSNNLSTFKKPFVFKNVFIYFKISVI